MYNKENKRLFVDMDGTLAEFKPTDEIETLYEKGYFAKLKPQENVVGGLKAFITEHSDVEVYVLSSVLSDSSYALSEKTEWLDKYLHEIDEAHQIFVPCGENKVAYVPDGISENDILLDDYSENLHAWENQGGLAIKLMNGINGNKGTWRGERISYQNTAENFKNGLYLKIIDRQVIRDNLQKNFKEYEENKEDLAYATRAIAEIKRENYERAYVYDKESYSTETHNEILRGGMGMKEFVYGMRLRGFSIGCQPKKGLLRREDDTTGKYHDIIVYDRKLTEQETADYELDFIGAEVYRTELQEIAHKNGWPMRIKARGYVAFLVGVQPLAEGKPEPIYRFPGGDSLVDECEMIPTEEDIYENLTPMITEGYFGDVLFIDSDFLPRIEIGEDDDLTFGIVSDVVDSFSNSFDFSDENAYDKERER